MTILADVRGSLLRGLLSLMCLLSASSIRAEGTSAAIPGQVPVDTLWSAFEARGDVASLTDLRALLERFQDEVDRGVATRCRDDGPELARLLERYPVSLRLWSLELGCAEHAGDASRTSIARGALRALLEHGRDQGRWPAADHRPIRVLTEDDVETWIEQSGLDELTLYYPIGPAGTLQIRAELWSAEDATESIWHFDVLTGLANRLGGDDAARVASARLRLIHELRLVHRDLPDSRLGAHVRVLDAYGEGGTEALIPLADQPEAQRLLADHCLIQRSADCAEAAVDAVQRMAASGSGTNLLYLTYAHAFGLGVAPDPEAAAELFGRARQRLGASVASQIYLDMLSAGRRSAHSQVFLVDSVREQARTGDRLARVQWLTLQSDDGRTLSPDERADLRELADLRIPAAEVLNAAITLDEDPALGRVVLQRAAVSGSLAAARFWLQVIGRLGAPPLREHMQLHEQVLREAIDPNLLSDYLELLRSRGELRRANQWLQVQAQLGLPEAMRDLALAMLAQADGAEGSPQKAREILEFLLRDTRDAGIRTQARRELAKLLLQGAEGIAVDVPAALAHLRENALDPESLLQLAVLLVRHPELARDGENGEALLLARAASDDTTAQYELAKLILAGNLSADDPAEGLTWLERAQTGSEDALNLYCWTLCTHPNPKLRDPARAEAMLAALRTIATGRSRPLETLAACHAANGRFEEAVNLQQAALDALGPDRSAKARAALESRLQGYRERQPYRDTD